MTHDYDGFITFRSNPTRVIGRIQNRDDTISITAERKHLRGFRLGDIHPKYNEMEDPAPCIRERLEAHRPGHQARLAMNAIASKYLNREVGNSEALLHAHPATWCAPFVISRDVNGSEPMEKVFWRRGTTTLATLRQAQQALNALTRGVTVPAPYFDHLYMMTGVCSLRPALPYHIRDNGIALFVPVSEAQADGIQRALAILPRVIPHWHRGNVCPVSGFDTELGGFHIEIFSPGADSYDIPAKLVSRSERGSYPDLVDFMDARGVAAQWTTEIFERFLASSLIAGQVVDATHEQLRMADRRRFRYDFAPLRLDFLDIAFPRTDEEKILETCLDQAPDFGLSDADAQRIARNVWPV